METRHFKRVMAIVRDQLQEYYYLEEPLDTNSRQRDYVTIKYALAYYLCEIKKMKPAIVAREIGRSRSNMYHACQTARDLLQTGDKLFTFAYKKAEDCIESAAKQILGDDYDIWKS